VPDREVTDVGTVRDEMDRRRAPPGLGPSSLPEAALRASPLAEDGSPEG